MNSRYVTAIDIGTSKLAAIVGEKTSTGIKIIGYSEAPIPANGVRRSEIMNPKNVISVIKTTMQKVLEQVHSLPDTEHYSVRDVFVNISGQSLRCCTENLRRNRQDPDSMISTEEVTSMLNEMYLTKVDPSENIMYVVPQYYNVDEFIDVGDPVGMIGKEISGDYRLFVGGAGTVKKCGQTISMSGLSPRKLILSPVAAASALLTEDEKELGAVLIDIGAGTTDVLIFQGNIIRHAAVIPFAGNSISEDVSQVCGVSLRNAELMKIQHGSCVSEYAPENKIISIRDKNGIPVKDVPFKLLFQAIEARTCEILATVRRIVEESGYKERVRSGAVITGGTAGLNHIQILARSILGMDVRIGLPDSNTVIGNSAEEVFRPEASVAVGLVIKGFEYEETLPESARHSTAAPQPEENATLFGAPAPEETAGHGETSHSNSGQKPPKPPKQPKKPFSERIKGLFDSTDDDA